VLVTSPQGTEDYTVHVTRPLCPPKLWTLTATPGVLTPPFNPEHLNYTLMLPNASVDAVTFTDTYPMPTGAPQKPLFLRCRFLRRNAHLTRQARDKRKES
jgi:hypothetical protein